ncbi:MAG: dipeptidyl-peptidase-4 [Rhodothermales bacterium]|jgi:dipeptidyl-peptidase-4
MSRLFFLLAVFLVLPASAQRSTVTAEDYARAELRLSNYSSPLVFRASVRPNWLSGDRFWYVNSTPEGQEFVIVNPADGSRRRAFDHARLASAISAVADTSYSALALPFTSFEYGDSENTITFTARPNSFTCDIQRYRCTAERVGGRPAPAAFGRFRGGPNPAISPDGSQEAFIRDLNLWVRDTESKEEKQLTWDGIEDFGYATNNAGWTRNDRPVLTWSPDSKTIATFQHDGRGVGMMYMFNNVPGHPELQAWKYPLPGDSLIFRIERVIIDVDEAKVVRLQMPPDMHRSSTSDHIAGSGVGGNFLDVQWSADSQALAFLSNSRDHQQTWLRIANPEDGAVRMVLHEEVDTFFEGGLTNEAWRVLHDSGEAIWFSERSNWGHLYMYDLATGDYKYPITSGDWNVARVLRVDKENRKIYFLGVGREEGDPYFQYLYSVNLDGTGLTLHSPENANHTITFSPSWEYFVDSYSTPAEPPVTVLRDLSGETVKLETADISQLVASGWRPPISFVTKARDGVTDIHGLLYEPANLDPSKKYPIINYLYPGPQSGSVGSRSFSPARRDHQALAELGFYVVELDGFGSPMRSKSFHAAYYGNMGDNGLPEQIGGIQQLAERNPGMDINRVGIWGGSGGGFASTAGILRYPDFYKVAVSGSGNHDQATYEDDWGEKWQGMLTTNPDGSTTYDNQANRHLVENLKGKLLLGHGALDGNVPVNNTMVLAEALMNAGKDFDMLIFPNSGHGLTPRDYWMRRRWDYFVEHLIGTQPPKEFKFGQQRNAAL